MAPVFDQGAFVLHPGAGPCRVVGVQSDALAGECLTLERMASPRAVIKIPVSKVAKAGMRATDHASALAAVESFERGRQWNFSRGHLVRPDGFKDEARVRSGRRGAMSRWSRGDAVKPAA